MSGERFSLDEISFRGLCMDLLRNFWMLLLAAAAMWFAATGWHNLTYQPEYTSSATLVVSVKGDGSSYSSLSMASQMAGVFGQVFQSDALRDRITEDVGETINARITCTPIEETNLLVLSAVCPKPDQAYRFLNSALKHYKEVAGNVFSNAALEIVQEPDIPSAPSNTSAAMRYRYFMMAAAAAGMAALICLLYVLRFTVKNPLCAKRQLDGKIRGVIPFEKKGVFLRHKNNPKQALTINSPLVSMEFSEAGRRCASKIEYFLKKHGYQILLVSSIGENEGKSTVAANLALALGEKHRRVLLVDGDLRKPAQYRVFEKSAEGRVSLSQVLSGEKSRKDACRYDEKTQIWEVFQFGAAADPKRTLREENLREILSGWKQEMDYIIVDCSPVTASADAEIWIAAADAVALVVREDWADIRTINDTVDMIDQNGKGFAGFVLNSFHREWVQPFREYGFGRYGSYGNYGGYANAPDNGSPEKDAGTREAVKEEGGEDGKAEKWN